MPKTRLLQAVCTVAMLAAAPAFAQSNTPTGDTGVGGSPNNPTTAGMPAASGGMAPAHAASGSHAAMPSHSTHRSGMLHPTSTMHAQNDAAAQDAAVARLNEQSYQAARTGQSYGGASPGSMDNMSGGSMSPAGATGTK